ncbi:hypothetical protein [Candidatus Nitrososphaera gargensis]|uniref:hypothetical protein n=1 Tax=Candidatus Nitrososphaera gargensis TaxID=497727 RepID=UPI0011E57CE9|nr:hypothetical protein [Candidatus Nitrososphaera gargensis]
MYNKWSYLSRIARGRHGRKYDTGFTYFFMLQFIRLALEKIYGAVKNSVQMKNGRSVTILGG